MTVYQAKGMQWPVVFLPALLRNRFPAAGRGGRNVWRLVPREAVDGHERYDGTIEDERRLFYVAMTRSQKFLHMTWAPIAGHNNRYARPSQFWENVLGSEFVKRRPPNYAARRRSEPTPRAAVSNVVFSFSDVKYFFECPYQFKLRILYGFNPPIHEALGYGRSLHNALAEVHARAMRQDYAEPGEATDLVDQHLHVPYAFPDLRENLTTGAQRVVETYIRDNQAVFPHIEFAEKQISIDLGDGVSVVGRIDLVRRLDTDTTTIVDLKSNDRAQPEAVTETQLHIYALGYQELTGRRPDLVEIYELDEGRRLPRSVDDGFIAEVRTTVLGAAAALRQGNMPATPRPRLCTRCDFLALCTAGQAAVAER